MVPTVELKQKKMILLKETSTGRGSDGEVYGAMGRAWERWGGERESLILSWVKHDKRA